MTDTAGGSASHHQEWVVVEALGVESGYKPTVVAEGGHTRFFSNLERRNWAIAKNAHEARKLSRTAHRAISRAVNTHDHVVERERLAPNRIATIVADPILSAHGEAVGAQVWVGNDMQQIPSQRVVAAFEWDYATQLVTQGSGMEAIHGTGSLPLTLHEIWRRFTAFDRLTEYEAYVDEFQQGKIPPGEPFGAEISLIGGDAVERSVYMTVRVREDHRGKHVVGIVHDISDVRRPKRSFDREIARTAGIALAESLDEPVGIGCLTLATGLFLEWYHTPPAALGPWSTETPEIDAESQLVFAEARNTLRHSQESTADITILVRFSDLEKWIPVNLRITAVGRAGQHGVTLGLVQVRSADGLLHR